MLLYTSGGDSLGIECRNTISITNSSGSAAGNTQAMSKSPTFTKTESSGAYTDPTITWSRSAE